MTKKSVRIALFAVFAFSLMGILAGADRLDGRWQGQTVEPSLSFTLTLHSGEEGLSGTLDVPERGVRDLPLADLRYDGSVLLFTVPLPNNPVRCRARRNADDSFDGTFEAGGGSGSFTMKPLDAEADGSRY